MVKFSYFSYFAWKRIKISSNTFLEDARRLIREAEVIQRLRTNLNGSEFLGNLVEVVGQKKNNGIINLPIGLLSDINFYQIIGAFFYLHGVRMHLILSCLIHSHLQPQLFCCINL